MSRKTIISSACAGSFDLGKSFTVADARSVWDGDAQRHCWVVEINDSVSTAELVRFEKLIGAETTITAMCDEDGAFLELEWVE